MSEPAGASGHRFKVAWIAAVFLIPALALPMPLLAQAYGNLFLPALLLLFGLGVMLHKAGSAYPNKRRPIRCARSPTIFFCERRLTSRPAIRENRNQGRRSLRKRRASRLRFDSLAGDAGLTSDLRTWGNLGCYQIGRITGPHD